MVEEKSLISSRNDDVERGPPDTFSTQPVVDHASQNFGNVDRRRKKKIWIFRVVKSLERLRYWVRLLIYFLPLAVALAVASILSKTAFPATRIGQARLSGLFLWLEIVWCSLWILDRCVTVAAVVFHALCQPHAFDTPEYDELVHDLKVPITIFTWAVVSFVTRSAIYCFDDIQHEDNWYGILSKVLVATIAVSAIFLAKQLLVELIWIDYKSRFIQPRKDILVPKVKALSLFYEITGLAMVENEEPAGNLFTRMIFQKASSERKQRWEKFSEGKASAAQLEQISDDVWNRTGRGATAEPKSREEMEELAMKAKSKSCSGRSKWYSSGTGPDPMVQGRLKVPGSLTRICTLLAGTGDSAASLLKTAIREQVDQVFREIDKDHDNKIVYCEVRDLVLDVAKRLAKLEQGITSLEQVVKSLDRILSAVVIIATAIVYGEPQFVNAVKVTL
jgi:hypothetical protein